MTTDNKDLITNEDLTVTILYKRFKHYYSYEAPINTVGGAVSGGGTQTKSYWTHGYEIKVKNTAATRRNFGFKFALFKDVESRDVDRQINQVLEDVKPGYTKSLDIDLFDDDLNALYLEDIYVIDSADKEQLAHIPQFCSMATEAESNITPEQKHKAKVAQYLLYGVPGFLILAAFISFLLFLGKEHEREHVSDAQLRISYSAARKAEAIDASMKGDWICVGDISGEKSDRMTIGYNTLSQGGTVVTLRPHTGLILGRNTLQKVPSENASIYMNSMKGTAIQLTYISDSSLKLENYVPIAATGGYKVETFTCGRG